jgi:hypothetical protein
VTVHRVGSVAAGLYVVGFIHGVAVLLDPSASSEEKGEAAVETVSSGIALAGVAGRWVPLLERVAHWSGPIAASLSINWTMLNVAAGWYRAAKAGMNRLDWVPCYQVTWQTAKDAQEWMGRLAVARVLIAAETDEPRKRELETFASSYRRILIDETLKPYLAARFSASSMDDDPDSCGPALKTRLRPVVGLVDSANWDDAALEAGRAFLETVKTAFEQWDEVVLAKGDEGPKPEHFIRRRAVVIKPIPLDPTGNQGYMGGVVHVRKDADAAAGMAPSSLPEEPYYKARQTGSQGYYADLLPGQVVTILLAEQGVVWVALNSLQTPILSVSTEENVMADMTRLET